MSPLRISRPPSVSAALLIASTAFGLADPAAPPPVSFSPPDPLPVAGGAPSDPASPSPAPRGRSPKGSSGTPALIEDGESGAAGIADYSASTYALLQNEVVGQGDWAFHLAGYAGDWFRPVPVVEVEAGCRLFFFSQLNWATPTQVAKVQISTDGGASWPATLWSQAGTSNPGDTGFSLQSIDLSSYPGSTVAIRFLYDYTGGTFYPQLEPGVGWHVDNIQVGQSFTKERYTAFGEPSDLEQLYLAYVNRARAGASAEATRLRYETDPLVTAAYSNTGVSLPAIENQFAWHVTSGCMEEVAQPLAFDERLLLMSGQHSLDMLTNSFQGHVSSANPPAPFQPRDTFGQRLQRVGYSGGAGENVYAYAKSVAHGHAGFDVDWGGTTNSASACYNPAFAGQGMQNPPGHRLSIHNGDFRAVGIGVLEGSNGGVGPQIVTQNFGTSGPTSITGVVFVDADGDAFYDPGEGVGGVLVESDASPFYALTSSSGGYALPVDSDGAHAVSFSGGGVAATQLTATVSGGQNSKLDYLATAAGGYQAWAAGFGVSGGPTADDDGDGVPNGVEYALANGDPTTPTPLPLLVPDPAGGGYLLTIAKNSAATGVSLKVLISTDLASWSASGYTALTDDGSNLAIRIPSAAGGRLFVRISADIT